MQNLTKREIVQRIYQDKEECRRGDILQNDVKDIVQRTLDILSESLAQGKNVELRNFGVLEVQVRKPRVGRNPTKPDHDVVYERHYALNWLVAVDGISDWDMIVPKT